MLLCGAEEDSPHGLSMGRNAKKCDFRLGGSACQVNQVTKALEEKVEQLQARAQVAVAGSLPLLIAVLLSGNALRVKQCQVAKEEIIAGRLKDEAFAEALEHWLLPSDAPVFPP